MHRGALDACDVGKAGGSRLMSCPPHSPMPCEDLQVSRSGLTALDVLKGSTCSPVNRHRGAHVPVDYLAASTMQLGAVTWNAAAWSAEGSE